MNKEQLIGNSQSLWKKNGGQSLIEILVAITLVALGIGFSAILFFGGQSITVDRENSGEASRLAKAGLEGAEAIIQSAWGATSDGTYGLSFTNGSWQFVGSEDVTGIFTRRITITSLDGNQKQVQSAVSWQASPARALTTQRTTLVTNWPMLIATGDDGGGGGLYGDWQNPRTLGTVDLGPGNSATDIDVKSKIIYLTAEASAAAKPDFFIVDAVNGQSPFTVSSLNTGPSLNALDVAGNYAYVGNRATNAQLQIIDVSNRNNPVVVSSFQLPGVSGSGAVGQSIFYASRKVYIGTKRATGAEFHIVDVANPNSPVALGSFEIGSDINKIYVTGSKAYLATSDSTELKILDVSDPAHISLVGSFDAPGDSEDGKTLQTVGSNLYLGRTVGGNHENHHELHILDIASSTAVASLGSKNFPGVSVNDLYAKDYLVFLATSNANEEFQIYNITDPANISFWSSLNFPQIATGIDYEDNIVYVSVRSNDAFRIITSQ